MYLDPQERDLFFKLFFDLLFCTNKKHKIVKDFGNARYPKSVDSQKAYQIKETLFENPDWINEYIEDYGGDFSQEERDILVSWRDHFIKGKFYVMRNLAKYSVFMLPGDENSTRLYGITGLNHPFADFFNKNELPVMINALILPFKDKIIYDGLFSSFRVLIGFNMRKELNDLYNISKDTYGIAETLPFDDSKPKQTKKKETEKRVVKASPIDEKSSEIATSITGFCNEKLNPEFLEVCLYILNKLRRKRPSPLLGGKANTWACGIVYAAASNNFVFDRSKPYYMTAQDIADGFGLSTGTAQSKAAEIKKMLGISYLKPEYAIASLRDRRDEMLEMMRSIDRLLW